LVFHQSTVDHSSSRCTDVASETGFRFHRLGSPLFSQALADHNLYCRRKHTDVLQLNRGKRGVWRSVERGKSSLSLKLDIFLKAETIKSTNILRCLYQSAQAHDRAAFDQGGALHLPVASLVGLADYPMPIRYAEHAIS
jgi:hypothetical protein